MDNKRLGVIIIAVSILLSLLLLAVNSQISQLTKDSCTCQVCVDAHKPSYIVYGGIALVSVLLSLGAYLLFFEKSQQAIIDKLNGNSAKLLNDEKFNYILLGVTDDEKKVLSVIREQDGISQHTLGLRTDMHKSKLSIVVGMLEQKGLIKKEKTGKTNHLFFKVVKF